MDCREDYNEFSDKYFGRIPDNTNEQIQAEQEKEDRIIEERFVDSMEKIDIPNEPGTELYIEKARNGIKEDLCFNLVLNGKEKIFLAINSGNSTIGKLDTLTKDNISNEDLNILLNTMKEMSEKVDSSEFEPNQQKVTDLGHFVEIGEGRIFVSYFPKGSGIGIDAVREIKKSVGYRNYSRNTN